MTYTPKVNDYVIWERHGLKDEGWVYFVSEPTTEKKGFPVTQQYLTIETGIRRKPECQYDRNNPHKYVHILLLCYVNQAVTVKPIVVISFVICRYIHIYIYISDHFSRS